MQYFNKTGVFSVSLALKISYLRILKHIICLTLLLLTNTIVLAINSPEIKCLSVQPNGDVIVVWDVPPDPLTEFTNYKVYGADVKSGPYNLLATINTRTISSYTYTGSTANTKINYFYIQTTATTGNVSPIQDTMATIFLSVTNPGNGTAELKWNAPSNPLPAGSSQQYAIYMEYPAGTWKLKATTDKLSYKDTISICKVHLNYYVEVKNTTHNCSSISNIAGGDFEDKIPPNRPILDSVSVNAAGQAVLGLSPSSSPDAACYIIYKNNGGGAYIAIDTVCGNIPTAYTAINSTAGSGMEDYQIASIDSCKNVCVKTINQNSLFLKLKYKLCERSVELNWNAYVNMRGGLQKYDILVSVNGTTFSYLGSTNALTFTHNNLGSAKDTYCYIVRAVNMSGSITASSNKSCIIAGSQSQIKYAYLSKVSVNLAQQVDVECIVDNKAVVKGINLYVAENTGSSFSYLTQLPFAGSSTYSYTHANVNTTATNYFYKAEVLDSCGLPATQTNISKTILLKVSKQTNFINTLVWDDYSLFLGNVSSYQIYRAVNGIFNPLPIATLPFGSNTYADDVSAFVSDQGKFSYYVEALEGTGNPYNIQKTSNSNIVHVYEEDELYIPNAFAPKGSLNTIFLPYTQYIEKTDYHFMIFNRYGEKIWETENDYTPWEGVGCQQGVYVYLITYKNARGEYKERKGTVTLIR